jgi:pimeloyl-ACP methyl ester carboxylesterase
MVRSHDIRTADGRILQAHEAEDGRLSADGLTLLWHHGSPQTGEPLEPLVDAATARGIRLVSYGRPSYGGSSPKRGRDVASAAADVRRIADELGMVRFAVMGASGGGPHALACAALLPTRVVAAVTLGGIAPYTTDIDWFAGMVDPGGLRAAQGGRTARERYAETDQFDANSFTATDWAALDSGWRSLGADAGRAGNESPEGLVDDDLALVAPWGFDPASIGVPVLLVHGGDDRVIPVSHAHWLLGRMDRAELWLRPRDGHVSVLDAIPVAMDWLLDRAGPADRAP